VRWNRLRFSVPTVFRLAKNFKVAPMQFISFWADSYHFWLFLSPIVILTISLCSDILRIVLKYPRHTSHSSFVLSAVTNIE